MNVRSGSFFLATAVGYCARCGRQTAVVAIGVPAGYERREEDGWCAVDAPALLSDIDVLPADVGALLQECFPHFHPDRTADTRGRWRNHCETCGSPQEDFWLHCEPDAPFLPQSPQAASRIELLAIGAVLLASACGFSDDIPFLNAMRRVD